MRVIAGSARGRKLVAPPGLTTRPTSDRAREAIFSMLAAMRVLDGAAVADLFAGSGAFGIEALSRGAVHATFVDDDRAAVTAISANLATLGFASRATVLRRDAGSFTVPVDLAFVDPPYAFDGWTGLLDGLEARLAVLESDRELDPGAKWLVNKVRRYSGTVVTLVEQRKGAP